MRWFNGKTRWIIGLLVLSLLLGSTSIAWADEPSPRTQGARRRPVLRGEITGIDGTTLTLNAPRGEVTVLTDDETRFRVPGADEANLADLQISQQIGARGQWQEEGVLRARLILVIPENAVALRGTVGAILNQALTLVTGDGEVDVLTDEDTRFFVPGVEEPSLDDLEIGNQVSIAGLRDESGNIVARLVRAVVQRTQRLVRGEVTAIQDGGFILQTRRGEVTVQVDDQTRFRFPDVEQASLDDLTVGAQVLVGGVKNEDGSLLAKMVGAVPERPRRGRVVGQIAAVEGQNLTLALKSGDEVELLTDENTRFLVPGLTTATIADLKVGDTVGAQGTKPADETELPYAAVVAVLRDPEGRAAGVWGELVAVAEASLTIKTKSGDEVHLLTDEHTQFLIPGAEEASLDDLNVGDTVGAQVVEQDDGTLYASAVGSGRERPRQRRGAVRGEISAIEGHVLTLTTPSPSAGLRTGGEVTVLTDENTRFRLPGVEGAGIDDLEIGQNIGAAGRWNEDGDLQARLVGRRAGRVREPTGESQSP